MLAMSGAVATHERLHALDALRAVAMFLGIVLHGLVPFTVSLTCRSSS